MSPGTFQKPSLIERCAHKKGLNQHKTNVSIIYLLYLYIMLTCSISILYHIVYVPCGSYGTPP